MKKTGLKLGIMLIAFLLVGMFLVPGVSAQTAEKITQGGIVASPEQVKAINDLWGKDITIGEYFEKVHPEILKDMPDSAKADIYKHKMTWGKSKTDASKVFDKTTKALLNTITVTADHSQTYRSITYSGRSHTGTAVAYLYAEAYLKNDLQQVVSSTSWSGNTVNDVLAFSTIYYPAADSYYVHAWGYTPSPYMEGYQDTGYFNYS